MRTLTLAAAAASASVLVVVAAGVRTPAARGNDAPPARTLMALEESGLLVSFRSDDPGNVVSSLRLFHWPPEQGEIALMSVATRPATGELYGISRLLQLTKVSTDTGAIVVVGPRIDASVPGIGSQYMWLDFDPARDVARVVDALGHQVRLDPDTGEVVDGATDVAGVQSDADWHWAAGDPHAGTGTDVAPRAFAYAAVPGDPSKATAYAIVGTYGENVLVRIGDAGDPASADRGEVHTVASLGAFPGGGLPPFGFTIAGGAAYLELMHPYHSGAYLVDVDLATGAIGRRPDFSQGAQSPEPATMIGLPGKANFNALAWVPTGGVTPPAPPPPAAERVRVQHGSLRFHRLRHPADSVRLRGRVALDGVLETGDTVRVDLGGVSRTFQLDGRLRGAAGEDRIRFLTDRGAEPRFDVTLRAEDFSGELAVPRRGVRLTLPISISLDGGESAGSVEFVIRSVTTSRAVAVVR